MGRHLVLVNKVWRKTARFSVLWQHASTCAVGDKLTFNIAITDIPETVQGLTRTDSAGMTLCVNCTQDGGMKAGTINKFPEYIGTKYVGLRPPYYKNVVNKSGKTYYPPQREKSILSYSVLNYNVDKCVYLKPVNASYALLFQSLYSKLYKTARMTTRATL